MYCFGKFVFAVFVGASLSACGGGGSGKSYEERLLDRANDATDLAARVESMALSGPRVVDNTTGSANFRGSASIIAGPVDDGAFLIGDADLTVDFDNATRVDGSITNIGGVGNYNIDNPDSGDIAPYSGEITLSGGTVGPGNSVEVDYDGTIRGNGDTLVFDGNMDGVFSGNPEIRAVTLYGEDVAQHNGVGYNSAVSVIAVRR